MCVCTAGVQVVTDRGVGGGCCPQSVGLPMGKMYCWGIVVSTHGGGGECTTTHTSLEASFTPPCRPSWGQGASPWQHRSSGPACPVIGQQLYTGRQLI